MAKSIAVSETHEIIRDMRTAKNRIHVELLYDLGAKYARGNGELERQLDAARADCLARV